MNNVSVLPWYKRLDEQNAMRWWVPGIYPLISSQENIIPSFIERPHTVGKNPVSRVTIGHSIGNARIASSGAVVSGSGAICWAFPLDTLEGKTVLLRNVTAIGDGYKWSVFQGDDFRDAEMVQDSGNSDTVTLTYGGAGFWLVVQWNASAQLWRLSDEDATLLPRTAELYTKDGEFVSDLWAAGFWRAVTYGDKDYLIPEQEDLSLPIGQYYIKASDGSDTWYSDVFTVVETALLPTFLKIEWWNAEPIDMEGGSIVPSIDQLGAHYTLYLKAEIAKPEYTYDEEGETRDGHFYPTKQLSQKVYKFAFLAPEFLLDAIRLLPLADHITITTNPGTDAELVYTPEQILLTPNWESEGDIASVSVEFRTDTVVKKLGLAYIR